MTTIAPNAGDMANCNKKPRCKWGEYSGQSLPSENPEDYCPDGYVFREDYCDCELEGCYEPGLYSVAWTANFTRTARTTCSNASDCNVDCDEEILDCGAYEYEDTFFWNNVGSVSCIVPRFYDPFTDACGVDRLYDSANIFACPPGADPDFGACGPALDGFSPSGCDGGAIDATYTLAITLVE